MPILATVQDLAQGLGSIGGPLLPLLLLVLVPLGALATIGAAQLRRHRQEAASRAMAALELALGKRSLTPRQRELAAKLAAHAPDPLRRHDLLALPRVFQAAVERARRTEELEDSEVAALRVALGFGEQEPQRTPRSTAELGVDTPLIVEQEKVRRFRARTQAVEIDGITILAEDGETPPARGSNLQIYFKREGGVFTFASRVIDLQGSRALIAHSERIGRYQKRRYYRRKLAIPVQLRRAGSAEKLAEHRFLDLGGGGASITNPDLRFRPGDDIEITFSPGAEGPIDLVGEVVRLSRAGKVMHVAFGPMREAMRDRIIRYILRSGRNR